MHGRPPLPSNELAGNDTARTAEISILPLQARCAIEGSTDEEMDKTDDSLLHAELPPRMSVGSGT